MRFTNLLWHAPRGVINEGCGKVSLTRYKYFPCHFLSIENPFRIITCFLLGYFLVVFKIPLVRKSAIVFLERSSIVFSQFHVELYFQRV
jgi:hypothetical protein